MTEQTNQRTNEQTEGKYVFKPAFFRWRRRAVVGSFATACRRFLVATILVSLTSPALAQGCVMCKTTVAAQLADAVRSINLGILVLLVPPVAIMATILAVAFHRAKE